MKDPYKEALARLTKATKDFDHERLKRHRIGGIVASYNNAEIEYDSAIAEAERLLSTPSIQVSEGEDKPVHMMTIFDVMSAETVAALSEALASEEQEPEKESDYIRGYRDGYAEAEYQRTNMH